MSVDTASTVTVPTERGITPVPPDFQDERAEQERERRADCPELLTFLKRTCEMIKNQRTADWERILSSQVRCIAYYDDRQYGTVKDGVFVDARREPGDIRPIDNQYKIQVDKLTMEMARSFPDIQVKATDPNDTRKVEAAKFAQSRVTAARKRLLKNSERLRECQALLLKTITYRYVYFDREAKDSPKERRPRKDTRSYGQTRSIISCKLCGGPMKPYDGADLATAKGAPSKMYGKGIEDMVEPNGNATSAVEQNGHNYRCINCGSNRQKVIELAPRHREVVTGYDEVRGGQVMSRHIDPTMVRISLSARRAVADSPFLWYHQRVARCILEDAYPKMKIRSGSGMPGEEDRHKRDLEGTPSNAMETGLVAERGTEENQQGGDQLEECPFDLIWLDPVMYRRVKFSKPQRLMDGRTLPAGTEAGEMWPDGMCIASNSGEILNVYGENKNRKWLFCVYGIREHALHGSGTNHLLGPQDTRNDLKSYLIANVYYNCGRREFIRSGAFTGNRLPAINEAAIVNDVPEDKPVEGWAYQSAKGEPLSGEALQLYQSEAGALQEGAGTSSLDATGASPDLRKAMGTATGVMAMRDSAVGRMGPNLMLQTEMEEEWGHLVLEHELDNFTPERFLKMANQAVTPQETEGSITFSADGIKAFLDSDPRTDFEMSTVPGSWTPRTEAERQAKMGAFLTLVAQIAKAMPGDPRGEELIAIAADVYGVTEVDLGGWTSTEQVAAARIRAYAETVATFEKRGRKAVDEELIKQVIAATPLAMVDNELDNHPLFLAFYQAWWASDEGQSCSPLLRAVIKTQHILHRAGIVYQAQNKAVDQLQADAPKAIAAAETAKEAAPPPPPPEIDYKTAPPHIRRQMEIRAGYEPASGEVEDDGTAAESAKTAGTLAAQAQKGEIEIQKAAVQSELKMAEMDHQAEIDARQKERDAELQETENRQEHERELESLDEQQGHERLIRSAELHQEAAIKDADRAHDAAKVEHQQRGAKEIAKLKAVKPQKGG